MLATKGEEYKANNRGEGDEYQMELDQDQIKKRESTRRRAGSATAERGDDETMS